MGLTNSKDPNIDLFMSTNKQYYIAGEYVEGQVYLNVENTSQYSNICLKLEGEQRVYWSQGGGKNTRVYSNSHKSYSAYQLLVDFHGIVNQGQYSFPFALLLPSMMNSSFIFSRACSIKYMFRAQLVHPTEEKKSQYFQFHLNVIEPPRMPIGSVSLKNTANSKCCGCCMDYGFTAVALNSDKNFVVNGQSIKISGIIDNTKGKQKIKEFKVLLQEKMMMVSSGGHTRNFVENQYPMLSDNTGIPSGGMREFNFIGTIPQQIFSYTAIGRCIARYFVLHLYTSYGCCSNTAEAELHLIVHSKSPMVVEKKTMPPPQNWNPKVYPKVTCQSMKPFIYSPMAQIPFLNMPGNQNANLNTNYNSQSYPNLKQGYQDPSDFNPQINQAIYQAYQPTFYNPNMLSEEEQAWQGYKGYQPYFAHEATQANLARKL